MAKKHYIKDFSVKMRHKYQNCLDKALSPCPLKVPSLFSTLLLDSSSAHCEQLCLLIQKAIYMVECYIKTYRFFPKITITSFQKKNQ